LLQGVFYFACMFVFFARFGVASFLKYFSLALIAANRLNALNDLSGESASTDTVTDRPVSDVSELVALLLACKFVLHLLGLVVVGVVDKEVGVEFSILSVGGLAGLCAHLDLEDVVC